MPYCRNCGRQVNATAFTCPACGASQGSGTVVPGSTPDVGAPAPQWPPPAPPAGSPEPTDWPPPPPGSPGAGPGGSPGGGSWPPPYPPPPGGGQGSWPPPPPPQGGGWPGSYGYDYGYRYPGYAEPRNESLAVASLVLGIVGLIVCPIICSVLAMIFSVQSRKRIERDPAVKGESMARAGFWLGVAGLFFWIVIVAVTTHR